jgi:hypothetical protein
MCDFISWIEKDGKIYYLDKHCLLTKEGKELRKYLGDHFENDIKGHGAIDRYWGLKGKGVHKECTDFSTPENFPKVIVDALLNGDLIGIGIPYTFQVLNKSAYDKYKKVRNSEYDEYLKVEDLAYDEYLKVRDLAYDKYEKVRDSIYDKYEKVEKNTFWEIFLKKEKRSRNWK